MGKDDPSPFFGIGTSIGHHGELLQGVFQDPEGRLHRGLVSIPCPLLESKVVFAPDGTDTIKVEPGWKTKARRGAEIASRATLGQARGGVLSIISNIPVGRGLGSSTSDVVAAMNAVFHTAGRVPSPELLGKVAVEAETASDSVMYGDRAVLFAQREGRVLEDFGGRLPDLEILGVTGPTEAPMVETLALAPARYAWREIETFRAITGLLRRAIANQCPRLAAKVATASARMSQRHLPKPHFDALLAIAQEVGAPGVHVAHSGTVMGLLFDPRDPTTPDRIDRARREVERAGLIVTWQFRIHPDGPSKTR